MTLLSSGEYSEDIVDMDIGQNYIWYFIALYFNFIIMMNLLIAIIGERFGVVLEQTIPLDCLERATFMKEIEEMKYIFSFCNCLEDKKTTEEQYFIHFAKFHKDPEEEDPEVIELEGRMRNMQTKLDVLKGTFKTKSSKIQKGKLDIHN